MNYITMSVRRLVLMMSLWELELLTKIHSHVVPLDMAQLFNLMRCGAGLHSGWGRGDTTLLGHAIGVFREQGNVLYVTLTKN